MISPLVGILFVTLAWGLFNRGRGWGPILPAPKWLVILSKWCNRWTMGLASALTLVLFMHSFGIWSGRTLIILIPVITLLWFVSVVPGIGDYQDGNKYPNSEIKWIDNLVTWLTTNNFKLFKWVTTPADFDNLSVAIRGVYRLPLYLVLGVLLHTVWLILPALFFWMPGVVYRYIRPNVKGDFEFWVEWIDYSIVGFLISLALTLYVIGQ